ncbi:hypothetical protein AB0M43_00005 [Longispora sp. NPDC051575]|uniref:hypothetical protein n=1 Tax=Longispora sp. NPDC051575 TaxID=3154943 RepID=UPI0034141A77
MAAGRVKRSAGKSIVTKIAITCATGGTAYVLTNLLKPKDVWVLVLAVFIGGAALVVQFLVEFAGKMEHVEQKLSAVELAESQRYTTTHAMLRAELATHSEATVLLGRLATSGVLHQDVLHLAQHAANVEPTQPDLVKRFMCTEIAKTAALLRDLTASEEAVYDGDDWQWSLTLVETIASSLDATTYVSANGPNGELAGDDLWGSELAQRYLRMQAGAVQRGAKVRRLFLLDSLKLAKGTALRRELRQQRAAGVSVRLIDLPSLARIGAPFTPMVIFDRSLVVEFTPARVPGAGLGFVKSSLITRVPHVRMRSTQFEEVWAAGLPDSEPKT